MYGFSNNKYSQALKDAATPETLLTHGNINNHNAEQPTKKSLIHIWLEEFLHTNGDIDPKSGNIHIPAYITRKELFQLFQQDSLIIHPSSSLPSKSSFFDYFKQHYDHVRFLKHTRLGRCTFCMQYQER
jgi:hypothetical protein